MTPTASSELISPGRILDDCKDSLCAMQDCIVIDITKKQLEELCILLRWKFFGIGAANRLSALSPLTSSQSVAQGHRFPRVFRAAGLRQRPHGSAHHRVGSPFPSSRAAPRTWYCLAWTRWGSRSATRNGARRTCGSSRTTGRRASGRTGKSAFLCTDRYRRGSDRVLHGTFC